MPLVDQGRARINRILDDRVQFHTLLVEAQLAGVDAADVEQIVDEFRQLQRLPEDRISQLLKLRLRRPLQLQHSDGGENCAEGVTELVSEYREELVLPSIDLALHDAMTHHERGDRALAVLANRLNRHGDRSAPAR